MKKEKPKPKKKKCAWLGCKNLASECEHFMTVTPDNRVIGGN